MLQAFFLEVVIDNKINQYFNIDIDVSISIDYPSPSDTGIDTSTGSTSYTGIDNRTVKVCNWPIIDMRTLFGVDSRLH